MRDGKKQGVGSMLLELGKRKSTDHWERVEFRTHGCLQKNGAAEKECKDEDGLRGRWGQSY